MNPTIEQLYQSVMALPETERLELVDAVVAASGCPAVLELTGDVYLAEMRRRSADVDPSAWSSWADAKRRVHTRLGVPEPGDG